MFTIYPLKQDNTIKLYDVVIDHPNGGQYTCGIEYKDGVLVAYFPEEVLKVKTSDVDLDDVELKGDDGRLYITGLNFTLTLWRIDQ